MGNATFRGKNVLVTGGTGTFGQAFVKNLLERDEVAKVIVFSRDEWKQWDMQQRDPVFKSKKARYFLGDVRDEGRLIRAFNEVNFVVHAAALKQVPAAEYNPSECIKTNIQGAMNVINAALETGVERVVALSSDKAVNPINLYGATKLCSDKLFIAAKSYVGKKGLPQFSVVRYGNVLGSRGSLLPFWQKLIQEGKTLPITDREMTRFWITIPEAVEFVQKAFMRMKGGEIFIPKSPSVKIVDLAEAIAPGLKQEIIGIRPGEKIHEVLIHSDDAAHTYELDDCYAITQDSSIGKPVGEHFHLASNVNPLFMHDRAKIHTLLQAFI